MVKKILFVLVLLLTAQLCQALEAEDEPELKAFPLTTILKGGELNNVQITLINVAKPENYVGGDLERQILQNATLTAYNLEVWLESEEIEVKGDRIYLQSLPPSASVTLNFVIAVPADFYGKAKLKLVVEYERVRSVDLRWDGSNYTAEYNYVEERKEFELTVEVIEESKPELKAMLLTPEVYGDEYSKLSLLIVNTGLSDARSVVVSIEGFSDVIPKENYIPMLLQSNSARIDFEVLGDNSTFVLVVHYSYVDKGKVVEDERRFKMNVALKKLNNKLLIFAENPRVNRGSGVIELSLMNSYLHPISNLYLQVSAPSEFELMNKNFALGSLPPGKVIVVPIAYSLDDDAEIGEKRWNLHVSYIIQSSRLEEREEEVELRVKMPEAFIERAESGEKFNVSFSVDVDEDVIPNTEYRIDIVWKAENFAAREVGGAVNGYVLVKEPPWTEKYLVPLTLILSLLVVVALRIKVGRKRR